MLNLSDKELDRLSREAASEHDPGDLLGQGSWDKLEWRLDKELGRVSSPNPFRNIRRIPYYYVPAIILLVGVSYYFIRNGKGNTHTHPSTSPVIMRTESSGNPPLASQDNSKTGQTINDSSIQIPNYRYNSTPTPDASAATTPSVAPGTVPGAVAPSTQGSAQGMPSHATVNTGANTGAPADQATASTRAGSPHNAGATPAGPTSSGSSSAGAASVGTSSPGALSSRPPSLTHAGKNHRPRSSLPDNDRSSTGQNNTGDQYDVAGQDGSTDLRNSANSSMSNRQGKDATREPDWAIVQPPLSLTRKHPAINDSALRAYTPLQGPLHPDPRNNATHRISRALQFGVLIAPDFASVNSLAGDKPGSSMGLTVDYQFANRWHIGTGLLLTKKNYTARIQDFHAPYSFLMQNNLHNVDLVKGQLSMLEIPLNLRYDFSVINNTIFFVSGGVSSYLRTDEKCKYYYNWFGLERDAPYNYHSHENYLFSVVNLSVGVEAGISNSISLLVAPYMKLPTGNGIGFGQIQVSSVGIDLGLKYAPVLSRKRH